MANALPPMFHGDGCTGENPQNFIHQLRSAMRTFTDIATDTQKIEMFADNLSTGSEADDWFLELPDSEKATWPTLQTAFSTRWPAMPPAKKSGMEIQRELYGKRIDLDKLRSKVKVGDQEVWYHVTWAAGVLHLAEEAKMKNSKESIWQVHDSFPLFLKDLVSTEQDNWTVFCKAVRELDPQRVCEGAEKARKDRDIEASVLQLATAFRSANINSLKSLSSSPHPATQRTQPTSPQYQMSGNHNFTEQGTRRPDTSMRPPTFREPITPDRLNALRECVHSQIHHSNTEEGRRAYREAVYSWVGINGRVTETTP